MRRLPVMLLMVLILAGGPRAATAPAASQPAPEFALTLAVTTEEGKENLVATVTRAGMLFIPSKEGKSHRPDEASDPRAIERGANVLLHTLLALVT